MFETTAKYEKSCLLWTFYDTNEINIKLQWKSILININKLLYFNFLIFINSYYYLIMITSFNFIYFLINTFSTLFSINNDTLKSTKKNRKWIYNKISIIKIFRIKGYQKSSQTIDLTMKSESHGENTPYTLTLHAEWWSALMHVSMHSRNAFSHRYRSDNNNLRRFISSAS